MKLMLVRFGDRARMPRARVGAITEGDRVYNL